MNHTAEKVTAHSEWLEKTPHYFVKIFIQHDLNYKLQNI